MSNDKHNSTWDTVRLRSYLSNNCIGFPFKSNSTTLTTMVLCSLVLVVVVFERFFFLLRQRQVSDKVVCSLWKWIQFSFHWLWAKRIDHIHVSHQKPTSDWKRVLSFLSTSQSCHAVFDVHVSNINSEPWVIIDLHHLNESGRSVAATETEEEQSWRCWLQRPTNQKSHHDASVYMESMDGRLPMSLWDGATACRQRLWIWQSGKLSVCGPEGAGRCDGLNAEWDSQSQTHLNTSATDGWAAARVLVSHHSDEYITPPTHNHRDTFITTGFYSEEEYQQKTTKQKLKAECKV